MTNQVKNILAAISYHSQFPGEEMVTFEVITFVGGRIIGEFKMDDYEGAAWFEVRREHNFHVTL